jgi:hypothetical protein
VITSFGWNQEEMSVLCYSHMGLAFRTVLHGMPLPQGSRAYWPLRPRCLRERGREVSLVEMILMKMLGFIKRAYQDHSRRVCPQWQRSSRQNKLAMSTSSDTVKPGPPAVSQQGRLPYLSCLNALLYCNTTGESLAFLRTRLVAKPTGASCVL